MQETTAEITGALTSAAGDPGIIKVVLMGIGVVFAGLIIIIFICKLMALFGVLGGKAAAPAQTREESAEEKPDGTLAAVIGTAISEDIGVDVSGIRIVSIKRVTK